MLEEHQQILLDTARDSIAYGLEHNHPLPVSTEDYPEALQHQAATFVTLFINKQLRGCIGMLEAVRPLVNDVADNAFSAAFRDPRFTPLEANEFPQLEYHISILSKPEPMSFTDESDALAQLRPHVDGLIFEAEGRRSTFLPSVWESLEEPGDFMQQLKRKAGLPASYWSNQVRLQRYQVEEFSRV